MPWLAWSHLEAPSPHHRTRPQQSRTHCHRRHCSSVADDYTVAGRENQRASQRAPQQPLRTLAISPLSPRWSVASLTEEAEIDLDDINDIHDVGGAEASPTAIENSPSYRNSVLSMASTNTTSTTSTLRRYWSPSPSTPTSSSRPPSRSQRPLSLSSSPPYVVHLSQSSTATSGMSTAPASSPSSAPSTTSSASSASTASSAPSTAHSTAPSTSYAVENIDNAAVYRPPTPVTSDHVVVYIPPLVDGAGGTLSRWQRIHQCRPPAAHYNLGAASSAFVSSSAAPALTPYRLLASDLRWLAVNAPDLLRLAWTKASTPLWAVVRPRAWSWSRLLTVPVDDVADAAEALLQTGLAVAEVTMLAAGPALFLCLPGALFLTWLLLCLAAVYAAAWPLNGGAQARTGTVYRSWAADRGRRVEDDDDGLDDSDDDDDDSDGSRPKRRRAEHWFFVPGLGATSQSLAKTGPRVAAVFGRPVTLLRPAYTYGAVADALVVLLQRLLLPVCVLPAPGAYGVYAELRRALLATANPRRARIVVLAHNAGATAVSQALARLASDVPAARLATLEVYTFGSLAPDFVLRSATAGDQQQKQQQPQQMEKNNYNSSSFHVEHVAHAHDPCARFGVLRSVRDDLAGRYGGGVFVVGSGTPGGSINSSNTASVSSGGVGLGISLNVSSTTSSFRSISRGRSVSPPFPPSSAAFSNNNYHNNHNSSNSIANISNRTSRHRMSFPFTYQQQQQHQYAMQNATYRRSASSSSTNSLASETSSLARTTLPPRKLVLTMEDYLTALFGPEPWSMRPDPAVDRDGNLLLSSSSSDAFFLSAAMSVDRELAERREMAAMAAASTGYDGHAHAHAHTRPHRAFKEYRPGLATSTAHHRLSWTGLGATAKYGTTKHALLGSTKTRRTSQLHKIAQQPPTLSASPAAAEGLRGLEAVRRLCKERDGRPGREVSILAGYFADAVARHREQFGF
ncbi:hypothetical protein HMPREF1624_01881 [Sporothrix schenckii ATCC 58251]|uniref:Uncharacterized protein n=1 Tax=Sporothrix schenckii (strain ATCC 58251 / de Perez 2211183) TaxID=1391915 RepID=U7Q0E4_SPOS1|nr:hypothetical protein HMPREF1624_01881 [Sporothrix schenckii ATCC 58251]